MTKKKLLFIVSSKSIIYPGFNFKKLIIGKNTVKIRTETIQEILNF